MCLRTQYSDLTYMGGSRLLSIKIIFGNQIYLYLYKWMCVCLYSMDSKTTHPITANFWDIIWCIPEKVFVHFHNPREYHYKKFFVHAISQWEKNILVWKNVTYIPGKVFVNYHIPRVYHYGGYHTKNYLWMEFLNERIIFWYGKLLVTPRQSFCKFS